MTTLTYHPDTDFYDLLGLDANFTPVQLKKAYRKLARELHPDTNPDPRAGEKFKLVTLAYEVLSDKAKRADYDRLVDQYYLTLPPILRLSKTVLDFGSAQAGDQVQCVVFVFNDGGDGPGLLCWVLSPTSGWFWTAQAQGIEPGDPAGALAKFVFTLAIQPDEKPGGLQHDISVHLQSGSDVSTRKLTLIVDVLVAEDEPPAAPAPPPAAATTPPTVVTPRPRAAAKSSIPDPYHRMITVALCIIVIGTAVISYFAHVGWPGQTSSKTHTPQVITSGPVLCSQLVGTQFDVNSSTCFTDPTHGDEASLDSCKSGLPFYVISYVSAADTKRHYLYTSYVGVWRDTTNRAVADRSKATC